MCYGLIIYRSHGISYKLAGVSIQRIGPLHQLDYWTHQFLLEFKILQSVTLNSTTSVTHHWYWCYFQIQHCM